MVATWKWERFACFQLTFHPSLFRPGLHEHVGLEHKSLKHPIQRINHFLCSDRTTSTV